MRFVPFILSRDEDECYSDSDQHGRMNYKDTKPYMSAFLSVGLLTDFAAFC
jgi:hypothetical protein